MLKWNDTSVKCFGFVVYQLIGRAVTDSSSRVRVVGLAQQSCCGIWRYVVGTVVFDFSKDGGLSQKEGHTPPTGLSVYFSNNLKIPIYKNLKIFYLTSLTVEDTR